jgi:ferric-dicitrate binding protein FerR (iron transport regulator)
MNALAQEHRTLPKMDVREREEASVRERTESAWHALDRRSLLAAAIGAVIPAQGAQAQITEQAGSVEEIMGEAFAEARAQRRVLGPAAPLFIDDLVGTGPDSRLTLHLGRDTTLRLGQKARLTIDRLLVDAGGEITLQAGPILFNRPAGSTPAPTRIKSAYGLIAVRGTRFFAGPSADVFGVFVERGSVAVSAAGRQVLVRAGQGTNIPRPGDAPTPAAAWGAARVRAALESVE